MLKLYSIESVTGTVLFTGLTGGECVALAKVGQTHRPATTIEIEAAITTSGLGDRFYDATYRRESFDIDDAGQPFWHND